MYPHERSLVQKYADEPFAIVGINTDPDLDELRIAMEQEKITWRSFWNGKGGTTGPITSAWNATSFPTIYVLDHEGVIRFKDVREKALDAALEELLPAARGAK